jgi:hypothetical protein
LLAKVYYLFGGTLIVGVLGLGTLYVSGDHDTGSPLSTFFLGRRFNAMISAVFSFFMWLMIYGVAEGMLANSLIVAIIIAILYLTLIAAAIFAKERVPDFYLLVLFIGGVWAAIAIWSGSIDASKLSGTEGWRALNRTLGIRSAAFGFNVLGSFVVIIGAIQSSISLLRKHIMRDRAIGDILIALGVLVVASGGTFGGLLGLGGQAAISVPMAIGVVIMFVGFIRASGPEKKQT